MLKPRIDLSELRRLAADLEISTDEMLREVIDAVQRTSAKVTAEAHTGAPVFEGHLAGGIHARGVQISELPSGIRIDDMVHATQPHSAVIEEGREPCGPMPPPEPIRRYVELLAKRGRINLAWTGKKGNAAIDSATYFLRVAIARRGIAPRMFMDSAAKEGEVFLVAALDDVAERFRRRVEGS